MNPDPLTEAALMVTAALPADVNVTDWVAGVLSVTFPKATLVLPRLSVAVIALSCNETVFVTPPAVAVRVAVCAVLTAAAVAVKDALDAPAATVTEAGTVTALLLLARATVVAVVADEVSETVQASVPAPVSVALPQETALSVEGACPVPLRAIVAEPLEALLVIVSDPLTAPAAAGSKPIVNVAVWPGFNVTGVLKPNTVNPAPVTDTPLIVRAAVPEEVSVNDFVADAFSNSLPNATLGELRLSTAAVAFSCRPTVFDTPPAVAVNAAVWVELTAAAAAVNPALDAPAATVTEAGTVTALLLLVKLTVVALAAADVSDTVQASLTAPVSDALLHVTPLSTGVADAATPVPLRLIFRVP